MALYYTLREVADYLGYLATTFTNAGIAVNGVWLIGEHLAARLITMGVYARAVSVRFDNAASQWYDIYNDLSGGFTISGALQTLMYYADDLVSFIRWPSEWIRGAISERWSNGVKFLNDPVAYVIETLVSYTGFDYDFVFNPFARIRSIADSILGALREIRNDPDGWIIRKINSLYPAVIAFLRDPDGWLIQKIYARFPVLSSFMQDPDTFIVEKFIAYIERVWDRYRDRLAKIAENILNSLLG